MSESFGCVGSARDLPSGRLNPTTNTKIGFYLVSVVWAPLVPTPSRSLVSGVNVLILFF